MNPYRFLFIVAIGCCFFAIKSVRADDAPPFTMSAQFSAEQVVTTKDGTTVTSKIYSDNGKMRTEMDTHGMQMVSIIRPDQQKIYSIMVAQKMVMEMPYDPEKYKQQAANITGPQGKFEAVGPDTVEGVACTKYKVTSQDGKVMFYWVDMTKKLPVKMAADDGSFTLLWKNYVAGPQDATLFEPPADYQKMAMPSMPGAAAPGGPAESGQ